MNAIAALALLQQAPVHGAGPGPQPAQVAVAQNPYKCHLEEAYRLMQGENANFPQAMVVLHLIGWSAPQNIRNEADLARGIMHYRGDPAHGFNRNYGDALLPLRSAADDEDSFITTQRNAQLLIGLIFKDGQDEIGFNRDPDVARDYLLLAAQPAEGVPASVTQQALNALAEIDENENG